MDDRERVRKDWNILSRAYSKRIGDFRALSSPCFITLLQSAARSPAVSSVVLPHNYPLICLDFQHVCDTHGI